MKSNRETPEPINEETLVAQGVDSNTIKTLVWGVEARSDLKAELETLNERVKAVNAILFNAMTKAGVSTFAGSQGLLTHKLATITHTLNKAKLKVAMLKAGLSAEQVKAIIAEATDDRQRAASMDFRRRTDG